MHGVYNGYAGLRKHTDQGRASAVQYSGWCGGTVVAPYSYKERAVINFRKGVVSNDEHCKDSD